MNDNYVSAADVNEYRHIPIPEEMAFQQRIDSMGTLQKELRSASMRNGALFTTGNQMELVVNMNQAKRFCNFRDAYFDIKTTNNTSVVGGTASFEGRIGLMSLIDNLLVETDSSTRFSYVTDCAELIAVELSKNVDYNFFHGTGKILYGTDGADAVGGESIAKDASTYKVLPAGLMPSGVLKQKYFPMFGEEHIRIVIDLNSAIKAAISAAGAPDADSFSVSEIKFWYDVYTLTDDQYNSLLAEQNGIFRLYGTDWTHITDTLASGDTGKTTNLGIAKKKCRRVIAMIRATSDITDYSVASITNRNYCNVTQYYLTLDDAIVGQKEINFKASTAQKAAFEGGSAVAAEMLKANGGLMNVHTKNFNVADSYTLSGAAGVAPAGNANADVGSFFMEIGLDNGFGSKNALSGLPCKSNAYFTIVKDAVAEVSQLDIYVEAVSQYTLDMNTKLWSVSS